MGLVRRYNSGQLCSVIESIQSCGKVGLGLLVVVQQLQVSSHTAHLTPSCRLISSPVRPHRRGIVAAGSQSSKHHMDMCSHLFTISHWFLAHPTVSEAIHSPVNNPHWYYYKSSLPSHWPRVSVIVTVALSILIISSVSSCPNLYVTVTLTQYCT